MSRLWDEMQAVMSLCDSQSRVIQFYIQLMDDLFTDSQNRLRLFLKKQS